VVQTVKNAHTLKLMQPYKLLELYGDVEVGTLRPL